jgi:sterol desaturase/sphingolipid hydroxylase (fatty acid hydroxylase superfamily)
LHPIFWFGFGAILLLERLYPAKPDQPTFSAGFAQDAVWFFVQPVLAAVITVTLATFLERVYRGHLSFLTIGALGHLPAWILFAWAVLLTDFLKWFHHWLRHKVPALWEFHAVHHSQRQMNLFTDLRYHMVEYLVSRSVKTFPLLALAADAPTVYSFSLFYAWYTRLYHANIRTSLGPLRYLMVTPQSHRVHHSIDPKHRDMNFGVLFTFWDWMFGTQYRGWNEYPDTGVADERFPQETTVRGLALLRTPLRQHVYPFLALHRKARRDDRRDPSR